MKKYLSVVFIALTVTSFCQITTTKISEKRVPDSIPYDSTENSLEIENFYQYVGQNLYLKGMSEGLRKYGYHGFILDYNKDDYKKENIYKCCQGENRGSNYDELVGKYFTVIQVIKNPKAEVSQRLFADKVILKLVENESKDTLYYAYDIPFPFIVVGYWIKYKRENVGKQFVVRYLSDELYDIETGEKVDLVNGSLWNCIDLTIEEKYFTLVLIFENEKGQKIMDSGNKGVLDYWEQSQANLYKKRFGSYWQSILNGHVKLGMTNEMCTLAWGDPESVNETILKGKKTEQWVYPENYLYFDNGILTAIQ